MTWILPKPIPVVPGDDEFSNEEILGHFLLMTLFTDQVAAVDDTLVDPSGDFADRRGWWGDGYKDDDEDNAGSKLWLTIEQGKITQPTIAQTESAIRAALQIMIDAKFISSYELVVERQAIDRIAALVRMIHDNGQTTDLKFSDVWEGI